MATLIFHSWTHPIPFPFGFLKHMFGSITLIMSWNKLWALSKPVFRRMADKSNHSLQSNEQKYLMQRSYFDEINRG
jgi:hypothetical protein